jgi:asparagine synthase (glutamine-hydrolysing)
LPSDEAALDELDALLQTVVRQEMIADVPLGAFLSGGIDSSLIVGVMQKVSATPVKTFSIGFAEGAFDESVHARAVAEHLRTEHTEIRLSPDAALTLVDRIPETFDEPFADSSQLPTFLVCQATRAHVTVALSGDGGDELFGGYSQYQSRDSIGTAVSRVPAALRGLVAGAVSALPLSAIDAAGVGGTWSANSKARMVRGLRDSSQRSSYESLLSAFVDPAMVLAPHRRDSLRASGDREVAWPTAATHAEAQMAYDMQTYLPDDILVKVDRCAMAVSLETRAPLLDHRIVEFALRQPSRLKIRDGVGKFLLRRLVARYVPSALLDRPKQGFAVPVAAWLRGPLRPWAELQLNADATLAECFDTNEVHRLWRAHLSGVDHADRLWRILMVAQWLRTRS